ncbi:hypothetical protein PLICRDRAFT_93868 [Plicaturopsis crispa FD-325 SS-3]|nr:hypothetical protein PLICRDRAFT_93868 [Plicaturopsis crispa FD-325 SS-3]
MSHTDWEQPPRLTEAPREYIVSAELYVSSSAASSLPSRKTPLARKKTEKRDGPSKLTSQASSVQNGEEVQRRLKEKGSWMNLTPTRAAASAGHWRPAVCRVSEEGDRCLLNIYIDESILYQTVYVHLLNHTDIRHADSSLVQRRDCLGIHCAAGQRWSSTQSPLEPLYISFPSTNATNAWLVLMRSYAIPEIYGRWICPADGGLYRIWRQVEVTVIQGRNLGNEKVSSADASNSVSGDDFDDAVDLDVSCDLHVNDVLCGRTTVKKGLGSPDWHESFTFADLPPFDTLDINVWREKRLLKPVMMGSIRIALGNFRRGETVEGWFPIVQATPSAAGVQVGDIRMKIRVDEEIILPFAAYAGLLKTLQSRNILDWMSDFESKLQLKSIATELVSFAIARNILTEHLFAFADREVDGTPSSHNTLFRGNTILTKTMELCMAWYGKSFLEASIGPVIRRLCNEKVAIEVDPVRSGKTTKEVERSVELLIHWCREFWQQIYAVRKECPQEMRRLFEHIRKLVERRYQIDASSDSNKELPWQSVSAFCFLRFIVPAILHPHLFGLCQGLPTLPVRRSLTLVAKVIQSLANLNTSVQKEDFMRGVKDFIQENVPSMVEYLKGVSTPLSDPYGAHGVHNSAADRHDRASIIQSLRERKPNMTTLDLEAIPTLPHIIDIPRCLAVISSAVIRNSKSYQQHRSKQTDPDSKDVSMDEVCRNCLFIEQKSVQRVSQLASQAAAPPSRPSASTSRSSSYGNMSQTPSSPVSPHHDVRARKASTPSSPPSRKRHGRKGSRPSTAPSDGSDARPSEDTSEASMPSSPLSASAQRRALPPQHSQSDSFGMALPSSPEGDKGYEQGTWSRRRHRLLHPRSTSSDSLSAYRPSPPEDSPRHTHTRNEGSAESDDMSKKKGLLRTILNRN